MSREHLGAGLLGRITRALPCRRWQAAHWLGKLLLPRGPFVGRFRGGRIEVRPAEVASAAAFYTGHYERELTAWCLRTLRTARPDLVVDVGANFGYYPLLFGLESRGRCRSVAFEPDPSNFDWLSRNLALNPSVRCEAVRAACGASDGGTIPFAASTPGRSLWSGPGGSSEVPCVALDAHLDRLGVGRVPVTLIDVEGHELAAVAGMTRGIAARRYAAVVVEFHRWAFPDPAAAVGELAGRFLAAGYSARRFRPGAGTGDHDPAYYRLRWSGAMLAPLSAEGLSDWEHFLFESPG